VELLRDVANSGDVFLLCGVFFAPFLSLHSVYCRKKNKIGTEIEWIILWYYAAFLKQKKYRKDKISHTNLPLTFVKAFL
jgi:hypothetical protein